MTTSSAKWYVAETHGHSERKAASHLLRQGFGVYLPQYLKTRRHARRTEIVPAPLFPRYLFVAVDILTQRWRAIQSTVGVVRLVGEGNAPKALVSEVVEALKRREDETGFIKLQTAPQFKRGDKVRVLDGPFVDCLGLYEGMPDSNRVAILLNLLGREVRVVLSTEKLVAA